MACCRHSEACHVVWALTDGAECKSRRIIMVARKKACIRHCSVDFENKPIIGAQASRVFEVVKRAGSIALKDTEPTSDIPGSREIWIEGNCLFDQRQAAADVLT